MTALTYKQVLQGGLPHRQFLTIPPIYLGMNPLPLKGVKLGDISGSDLIRVEQGGISIRDVKAIRQSKRAHSQSDSNRRSTKPKNKSNPSVKPVKKYKRVKGRFAK